MRKGKKVIYPGTFDPITHGHLDILHRATEIFGDVTIAVAGATTKAPIFSVQERVDLIKRVIKDHKFGSAVHVESFSGLLTDYARKKGVDTVIRGLRAISDFEYEFQMALMNRHLAPDLETVFLMPDEKYVYLSSSLVREVARLKGQLHTFLPRPVVAAVRAKFAGK